MNSPNDGNALKSRVAKFCAFLGNTENLALKDWEKSVENIGMNIIYNMGFLIILQQPLLIKQIKPGIFNSDRACDDVCIEKCH